MDIKSFKPRQTVYIVGDARRPRDKFSAVKAEVAKVGRKYVPSAEDGENGFGKRTTGICRISLRKQSMAHRVSCFRRRMLYASTKNVRN